MTFLDRTLGTGDTRPVWFLAEKDTAGTYARATRTRAAAFNAFAEHLANAVENGEPYTPFSRTRRLVVTGPGWIRLPASTSDPLPTPDAGLREALGDDYDLLVHDPRVAAVLES